MEIPTDRQELEDLQRHLEAFMLEILRTLVERQASLGETPSGLEGWGDE